MSENNGRGEEATMRTEYPLNTWGRVDKPTPFAVKKVSRDVSIMEGDSERIKVPDSTPGTANF